MGSETQFDGASAHRFFSVSCFNRTWELLDKKQLTTDEGIVMLLRTMTSLWHWTQRDDCANRNLSIGYWQASRVLSALNQGELANQLAQLSLRYSKSEDAFCRGYAYESLARAAIVMKDMHAASQYLFEAQVEASSVEDEQDRGLLLKDLTELNELVAI